MAPRRRRYRFIRANVDVDVVFHQRRTPPSRDAIERNVRDVRNVGYFPSSKGRSFFSLPSFALCSLFEEEKKYSFSVRVEIFFFSRNYVEFFIATFFRSFSHQILEILRKK